MPVPFAAASDERSSLIMFLEEQRAAILRKLDGLTDDEAMSRPTASQFCMLTLVKHVAYVERRWFQLEVARRKVDGLWPPPDDREFRLEPDDSVATVRDLYLTVIEQNRAILADDVTHDLDGRSELGLDRRWVLLHLIEELARHAGHADLIRETIDGTTGA